MSNPYQFPECLHPVAAALHMMGRNPAAMIIELPRETWWDVRCELQRRWPEFGPQMFDGRGNSGDEFHCMGIRFRAR